MTAIHLTLLLFMATMCWADSDLQCRPFASNACTCHITTSPQTRAQVVCSGSELDSRALKEIGQQIVGDGFLLHINNASKLERIENNTFNSTFQKIFIEQNDNLVDIEADAFKVSSRTLTLAIRNNAKLSGENVFKVVAKLGKVVTDLELEFNGFTAIPENAFRDSLPKVVYLRVDNNARLTTIGKNAFAGLTDLKVLSLSDNDITTVAEPFLNLNATRSGATNGGHVTLFLQNNRHLTRLTNDSVVMPVDPQLSIGVDVENCSLTDIPGFTQQVMNRTGGKLFLTGNDFSACRCDDTSLDWLTGVLNNERVMEDMVGVEDVKCLDNNGTERVKITVCKAKPLTTTTTVSPTTTRKTKK